MKSSVIRSLVMFAAGAGCATVVAGLYPPIEPITPELFQERLTAVLAEVEALGGYVGVAENGRIGIYTNRRCLRSAGTPVRNGLPMRSISAAWNYGVKAAVNAQPELPGRRG